MSVHSKDEVKEDPTLSDHVDASSLEENTNIPGDGDAALAFLRREEIVEFTPEQERKLVRKIDWMIVPLMWSCYFLQYLDKTLSKYSLSILTSGLELCRCYLLVLVMTRIQQLQLESPVTKEHSYILNCSQLCRRHGPLHGCTHRRRSVLNSRTSFLRHLFR
jgi:hypothetical protein